MGPKKDLISTDDLSMLLDDKLKNVNTTLQTLKDNQVTKEDVVSIISAKLEEQSEILGERLNKHIIFTNSINEVVNENTAKLVQLNVKNLNLEGQLNECLEKYGIMEKNYESVVEKNKKLCEQVKQNEDDIDDQRPA